MLDHEVLGNLNSTMKMMGVCLPCPLVPSGQLFIVVQSLSGVQLFAIQGLQHTSLPILHYLPEFAQIHAFKSVLQSSHLILCHPLLLLPSTFFSIRVLYSEWALHIRWPKYRNSTLSSLAQQARVFQKCNMTKE